MTYAVIDFETNSAHIGDVIECSIRKVIKSEDGVSFLEIDNFHRYYMSKYPKNPRSLDIHGLTDPIISLKRNNAAYPPLFTQDIDFEAFFIDVDAIVAHNLSFEKRHIDGRLPSLFAVCTMKENKQQCLAVNKNNVLKVPNLKEACIHYNIPFDPQKHHGADYDTEVTLAILEKMLLSNHPLFPREEHFTESLEMCSVLDKQSDLQCTTPYSP